MIRYKKYPLLSLGVMTNERLGMVAEKGGRIILPT